MKIGLMLIPNDDPTAHYGVAWDEFDGRCGYHRKDLLALYKKAKENLRNKQKTFHNEEMNHDR